MTPEKLKTGSDTMPKIIWNDAALKPYFAPVLAAHLKHFGDHAVEAEVTSFIDGKPAPEPYDATTFDRASRTRAHWIIRESRATLSHTEQVTYYGAGSETIQ